MFQTIGGIEKQMLKNQELAETAIREARKIIDYDTVEFPLEYFIDKINQQRKSDNLNWDESKQSYFIESLLLGLPVLNIVFINNRWNAVDENMELIDGRQRLYTAINFIKGNLELCNLKTLTSLNGFRFDDLILSRQKKFKRISVRAIAVNPKSDLSVWSENR